MGGPNSSPIIYEILLGERDYCTIVSRPGESIGGTFKSLNQAYDVLRGYLNSRGMIVGSPIPAEQGYIVEATPGPPLYAADASFLLEIYSRRFRVILRRKAVEIARGHGRALVTDEDIWAAAEAIVGTLLDKEPEDD